MSVVASRTDDGKVKLELRRGGGDAVVLDEVKDTDTCNYDNPKLDRDAVIACAVYYGLVREGLIVGVPKPPTHDK